MIATFGPVAALLLSVAILLAGNGLQGTLLPIRANIEGFTTLDIGILGSSYFLGFAAGCIFGPSVVRKVGHIRTFTAMSAVASAIALGHALLLTSVSWWTMRVGTGFCFAVLYTVIESWLNERATNETRGLILSVYLIINMTVITIGQMMVTLADPAGFALFAIASILVSLAAVPVALSGAAAPAPIESVRVRVLRLYRISPVGFTGCLTVGLANGAFWALGPVFAQRIGMNVDGVAVFMSAIVIAGAASQFPIGRLSDRIDRRWVLAGACLGAGLAAAGMVFFYDTGPHAAMILGAIWGAFTFPVYGIAVAHTNDFADPGDFVEVSSGLLLVYGAGAVIGPVLASFAMERFGPIALFVFTGAVHVAMSAFALLRMFQREQAPAEEHVTFVQALQAAQTVSPTFDLEAQAAAPESAVETPAEPPAPASPG